MLKEMFFFVVNSHILDRNYVTPLLLRLFFRLKSVSLRRTRVCLWNTYISVNFLDFTYISKHHIPLETQLLTVRSKRSLISDIITIYDYHDSDYYLLNNLCLLEPTETWRYQISPRSPKHSEYVWAAPSWFMGCTIMISGNFLCFRGEQSNKQQTKEDS
jgi:hypothetical protein